MKFQPLFPCFLFFLLLALLACGSSETQIKEEIQKAQACSTSSDCVEIGGKCPFGCSVPVHKTKADALKKMIDSFSSPCAYDCLPVKEIQCQNQRCTTIFVTAP